MEDIVSAEIVIDGKDYPQHEIESISIQQQYNEHHTFQMRFHHASFDAFGAESINDSKSHLGKSITISFKGVSHMTGAETDYGVPFKGIITDFSIDNSTSDYAVSVISGYSPTILLDSGETNNSFLDAGLTKVVKDVSADVASNDLKIKVNPTKKSNIPYITQYRESNFAFIRRLAAEYGEDFFYDGSELNFGKPSGSKTYTFGVGVDLISFSFRSHVAPLSFKQNGYLSKEAKQLSKPSKSAQVAGLEAVGKHAVSISEQLFKAEATILSRRKFKEEKELEEAIKIDKSIRASGLVSVHGSVNQPMKLGAEVTINSPGAGGTVDVGKFTVTGLTHTMTGGLYVAEFEGIPSSITVMPNPYFKKPSAESQIGVVTDNEDPDKLGKVKVKMLWQADNQTTPFIRVLTPHGGTYGDNKKTRGSFFTPEIDDYVILGFTQNDPDRPFVLGTLQNGKAIDSAPNKNNSIKSISTRSGNIITFTDKEDAKEQEINIQTDPTNYISINLKNTDGTIKIYSSKAIEVNSGETIVVKAAKSIEMQGDKTVTVKSEKITIEASDSITMKANSKIDMSAADVKIEASNSFAVKANATAKIESVQTEIAGSASAKVKGAMLDLEGSAMANLKAALVKIN